MQIELYIEGEKKLFVVPYAPMLANRKYLELMARAEEKIKENPDYPSYKEQIEEDDEMVGILANVVFDGQFTVEQAYKGANKEYIYQKLREAVFGKKKEKIEDEEGNNLGK